MAGRASRSAAMIARLDPRVSRVLFVKNLPFKVTAEELYDLFGRYGALRQVRVGVDKQRGSGFVVYEDIFDAKAACEHLSGFNVGGRYLTVLYYQPRKGLRADTAQQQAEVDALRARVKAGEEAAAASAGGAAGSKSNAAAAAAGEDGSDAGGGGAGEDEPLGLEAEEKDRKLSSSSSSSYR